MVTTLTIEGMRSVHCARAIHTSLARVPGIQGAEVVIGRATLEHDVLLEAPALTAAVEELGYTLRAIDTERRRLPLRDATGGAPGATH